MNRQNRRSSTSLGGRANEGQNNRNYAENYGKNNQEDYGMDNLNY